MLNVRTVLRYREIVVEVVESSVAASRFVRHCEALPRGVRKLNKA
jgi:hypothetical protein